jgi:MFS family permease
MILTIALITVGTAGLALTPTYAAIGIAAPCIVVFCRLVQGLALGGEVGPTTAFLIEIAPPRERGLYSSWQFASQGIAGLAAGAIGIGVSLVLAPSDLAVWGWRIPFVLCLALLPIAIILRNAMPETLDTGSPAARRSRPSVKTHARLIVLAIFVIMGATVAAYVASYMTTYALTTLHFGPTQALGATVASGLGTLIFAPVGGALADRYGRRMVMLVPRIILAVVVYPLFVLLNHAPGEATLFGATLIVSALNTASAAASFVVVVELLPRPVRATGLAIAYAVGVSLFGGTTQFIIAYLGGVTGNPTSPAWYVALTSIITVGAMWALPETRDRALAE